MLRKSLLTLSVAALFSGCSLDGDDGAKGKDGTNGSNGLNSLIAQVALPLGDSHCFFGGVQFNSGLDTNANGTLEDAEVKQTTRNCNSNPVGVSGSKLPHTVLRNTLPDGAIPGRLFEVRNGGYGSDMVKHPTNPKQFYALTDRGPNATYTGPQGKGKIFPTPDYTPRIGLFELQANGDVKKITEILLKDKQGKPISGLPNSSALGGTGETPYAINDDGTVEVIRQDMTKPYNETTNPIKLDDYGLDGEGLVALSDGSFWVSDEYGPHIVHFNAEGVEIGRINAFSSDSRNTFTLPAEFAKRRANRGMEGLAVTPDEKTLVGIMQSTMYNPSKAVKKLDIVRIVSINLESGAVSQYLYKQEKAQNSQSGIAAISNSKFVVIERDGAFFNKKPDAMKRLYVIDLENATDLETFTTDTTWVQDANLGLTKNGKTLEEVVLNEGWEGLTNAGIKTVGKTLLSDLVAEVSYPHDKLEGMWLINSTTIGVLNDDDFATWASGGVLEQKYLDANKTNIDGNTLYIIENLDIK